MMPDVRDTTAHLMPVRVLRVLKVTVVRKAFESHSSRKTQRPQSPQSPTESPHQTTPVIPPPSRASSDHWVQYNHPGSPYHTPNAIA